MKLYRIKHIPTGFYFCPSRLILNKVIKSNVYKYVKSNLSKKGKVYHSLPHLNAWLYDGYYSHLNEKNFLPFDPSEWIIEIIEPK